MEKEELTNYLSRKVLIGLSDSRNFRGFLKSITDNEAILLNPQYDKEIRLPIREIISIRVSANHFERFKPYKKFFWS